MTRLVQGLLNILLPMIIHKKNEREIVDHNELRRCFFNFYLDKKILKFILLFTAKIFHLLFWNWKKSKVLLLNRSFISFVQFKTSDLYSFKLYLKYKRRENLLEILRRAEKWEEILRVFLKI